jgi:sugar/nucleoside kinase (ribokinase family)
VDSALSTQHSALVPDFVICGNVVRDVAPGGWKPGGTAVYAAAVARGLGRRVGVVTAAPLDLVQAGLPADVLVARADVDTATSMENIYTPAGRVQYLRAPGSPIPAATLPDAWTAARLALIGPVYHEAGADLAARFQGRVGVCAQGFLRVTRPDGRIGPLPAERWDAAPLLRHTDVLFVSDEDLAGGEATGIPPLWLELVPTVVLTSGPNGAALFTGGRRLPVAAVRAEEVDPTGAGDSFAAAFLIALDEGARPVDAARFAATVAALAVETRGPCTPDRATVRARGAAAGTRR